MNAEKNVSSLPAVPRRYSVDWYDDSQEYYLVYDSEKKDGGSTGERFYNLADAQAAADSLNALDRQQKGAKS